MKTQQAHLYKMYKLYKCLNALKKTVKGDILTITKNTVECVGIHVKMAKEDIKVDVHEKHYQHEKL